MKEIFFRIIFYSYMITSIITIVVSVIFLVQSFWFRQKCLKVKKEKYRNCYKKINLKKYYYIFEKFTRRFLWILM